MKSILVIGMGEFGKHLATKLQKLNNEVCVVDSNSEIINVLSNEFDNAYVGDCMQKVTLNELGVKNYDICVVSVGSNFQASLEITANLKELGAKHIISKAHSDLQAKFLKIAGADETVYPEKDLAERLAFRCAANNLFDYFILQNSYSIFEIATPKSWIGKTLKELNVRMKYEINVIAIKNDNEFMMASADYMFKEDDHIYIFGKDNVINKLK